MPAIDWYLNLLNTSDYAQITERLGQKELSMKRVGAVIYSEDLYFVVMNFAA